MFRTAVILGALGLSLTAHVARGQTKADAPVASSPVTGVSLSGSQRASFGFHLGTAVAAGVVTVPVGLLLASGLGSLSNQLVWAALPALLSYGLLAPTLTTLVAYFVGNWHDPGRYGFWAPWAASVVVNALALVAAGFAGLSIAVPLEVLLFSVIDGVVVGGVSAGTMRLLERKPAAGVALRSFAPGVGDTTLVPVSKVEF